MHAEADAFVSSCARLILPERGLDAGGRDVNGQCRRHFQGCTWRVLDIAPGEGVDIVADFSTWYSDERFDLILCTEVLEHAPRWPWVCETAYNQLVTGGHFVVTAATDPRTPHSAVDGGPLQDGEYYDNVDPIELWEALERIGFEVLRFEVDRVLGHGGKERGDVRAMARKP